MLGIHSLQHKEHAVHSLLLNKMSEFYKYIKMMLHHVKPKTLQPFISSILCESNILFNISKSDCFFYSFLKDTKTFW